MMSTISLPKNGETDRDLIVIGYSSDNDLAREDGI